MEQDTYRPSVLSKYIRVELINDTGERVIKGNLQLSDSQVGASFLLPAILPTGWYYLRAYSNWMRNFSPGQFTTCPIRIVNPTDLRLILPEDPAPPIEALQSDKQSYDVQMILQLSESNEHLVVNVVSRSAAPLTSLKLIIHQSYTTCWTETNVGGLEDVTFRIPLMDHTDRP